ncbi:MAG: phenylacetate--CoA ligase family protein [Chitinophagales bacterium]|nr:phenylacetate--CoA ligase family protein [Chitinophagales bacterium]
MSLAESIYSKVPVWLQNVFVSLYGLQWKKRRFGGVFASELKQYKEREKYTAAEWEAYTTHQLRVMLLHTFNTVPYYRDKWTAAGITEDKLKSFNLSDIQNLPFLSKDDLRKYCKTTLLSDNRESGGSYFESSGTTGTPTSILFSDAMHQRWSAAYEARVRNWAGVDNSMSRGMIGGRRVLPDANARPPYYRYNYFEKQIYFSAYHISPATIQNYADALNKYKPDYMVGYAMSNYFLARFIKERGLQVPQMKAVITSSEKLTPEMREVMEDVYCCKTYDGWSGVEACGLVSECEHRGLHISPDVGLIEILNENGEPAKLGEYGEVVCTGFLNYDQPLIRYKIGDYMRVSDKQCSCGRQMPLVEEITGRIEDAIVGKDGREMVRFHGIFIGIPAIVKGQIVQETLEDIIINVQVERELTTEEREILTKRIYSQLGELNVQIFEMKEIPCGNNGKFRAVISKVKRVNL